MTGTATGVAEAIAALIAGARRDVESGWLPACQVAVARHGEMLLFETFGDKTDHDRFLIFSCTKPIVASVVWQLIGEGSLDISRPVADYVPGFEAHGKAHVTVEQVLLHTAGFPNATISPASGADPERRAARLASWELEWEPGTQFEYHATSAHWVLAELIGRISGRDFHDAVRERVTTPLGLAPMLGLPVDQQQDIAAPVPVGDAAGLRAAGDPPMYAEMTAEPGVIAAGVPGGGGVMTAADLAMFYQALIANPDEMWRPDVLADATGNIRCTLPEPLFGIAANRSIGLVIAGDDGNHVMRYAGFGQSCSPRSFGHAGMHMQVAWADPDTGISFAYLTNGVDIDTIREGARGVRLADLAARIGLA